MIHRNEAIHGLALRRAGFNCNPYKDILITRTDAKGNLLGGVFYNEYTRRSISMHVASLKPNWLNVDLLWVMFDYPFNQLGVEFVFGPIRSSNTEAIDFAKHIGFKEVTRIPEMFPDGDLVILRMSRDECKWLSLKPRTIRPRYLESNKGVERWAA